jgi:hypothetical protein
MVGVGTRGSGRWGWVDGGLRSAGWGDWRGAVDEKKDRERERDRERYE